MKIRGSDLEQIFGLSTNAVKYYEKNRILSPQRNPDNRYRIYSEEDLQLLGSALRLRHCGFSVEEAARMIDTPPDEQEMLRHRCSELDAEISRLSMIRDELRQEQERADTYEQLKDTCVFRQSTAVYFYSMRTRTRFMGDSTFQTTCEWHRKYPAHTASSMLLEGSFFTDDAIPQAIQYGICVDAQTALRLGIELSEHVTYMPPKPAVITAGSFLYSNPDLTEVTERIRRFAAETRLRLQGGCFVRILFCPETRDPLRVRCLISAPIYGDRKEFGTMK